MPKVPALAVVQRAPVVVAAPAALTAGAAVYTIAQIVAVSFADAYDVMKDGHEWADPRLNAATAEGRIIFMPLGAVVRVNGVEYDIKQFNVPTTWTQEDEDRNPTENERIALTRELVENTIYAHESLIAKQLKKSNLIISKGYKVERTNTWEVPDTPAWYFLTYTAAACVPKDIDLRTADIWTGPEELTS